MVRTSPTASPFSLVTTFKGPKKSRFLGPPPLKCPELWIVPPQNHFVPPHINNRYINSYYPPLSSPLPFSSPSSPTHRYKVKIYRNLKSTKYSSQVHKKLKDTRPYFTSLGTPRKHNQQVFYCTVKRWLPAPHCGGCSATESFFLVFSFFTVAVVLPWTSIFPSPQHYGWSVD